MWSSRAYPKICGDHTSSQQPTAFRIDLSKHEIISSCQICHEIMLQLQFSAAITNGIESHLSRRWIHLSSDASEHSNLCSLWMVFAACLLLQVENYEIELKFPRGDESTWNVEWTLQRLEPQVSFTFHREDFPKRLKVMWGFRLANLIDSMKKKSFF